MLIKEYINKNLPNLNWNILPQIFEENKAELTKEIENYLKETPGNTNWNVLNQMNKSKSGIILFSKDCTFTKPAPVDWVFYQDNTIPKEDIFDKLIAGDKIKVTIGENSSTGIITEQKASSGYDINKKFNLTASFVNDCYITWDEYGQAPHTTLYIKINDDVGTYHVEIEKL